MQKITTIFTVVLAFVFLSGCQQEEVTGDSEKKRDEKAVGYLQTLRETHEKAQTKIEDATEKQNEKNNEALSVIDEKTENNNPPKEEKSMNNNAPEQINMEFAQTCTGATIKTNKGDITLSFYGEDAPVSVANFCTLADKGFYNSVIFHRVIKDFMIQGGDPEGTGMGGPGYKFDDEIHANNKNDMGTISMANAGPGTNGSQFFINVNDNNFLDTKHTVFGKVENGMEVVTEIENVETGAQDRPKEEVKIESIELING